MDSDSSGLHPGTDAKPHSLGIELKNKLIFLFSFFKNLFCNDFVIY